MDPVIKIETKEGETIIRTGNAPDIHVKPKITLSGHIGAVIDYVTKRKPEPEITHVIMDEDKAEVRLIHGEQESDKIEVVGKLVKNSYIEKLGINADKTYSIPALAKELKLNGRYFVSRTEHAALMDALNKFQAKTEVEFKDSKDFAGSVAQSKIVKVTHEVPLNFKMKIPIYKGESATEFNVVIEVFPDGSSLSCQLVSVELAEIMETTLRDLFNQASEAMNQFLILKP